VRPRAVRKTEGTVFPNTDRPGRLVNNIFIFSATRNICENPTKFGLQSRQETEKFLARR